MSSFFECHESADTGKLCNSNVFESHESENTGNTNNSGIFQIMRGGSKGKTYLILICSKPMNQNTKDSRWILTLSNPVK